MDLWIFGYMKITIQKVKVTVRKSLRICGFLVWTNLKKVTLIAQIDVDLWIYENQYTPVRVESCKGFGILNI